MVFDPTKKVSPVSKKSPKEKAAPVLIAGISNVIRLKNLIAKLTESSKSVEDDIRTLVTDHFVKTGKKAKDRPANFTATDGMATASCELRIRGENSALSNDDVALLKKHNISTSSVVRRHETYVINPEHVSDSEIIQKLRTILEPAIASGDLPSDLFMKQDKNEFAVVGKTALNELFANHTEKTIRKILPIIGLISVGKYVTDETAEQPTIRSSFFPVSQSVMTDAEAAIKQET